MWLTPDQYHNLLTLIQPTVGSCSEKTKPTKVHVSQVPTLGSSIILCRLRESHNTAHTLSPSSPSDSWILDSRATDHATSSLKWFQVFYKTKPISVNLPNGSIVTAQYSGVVKFSPNFVLHSVLFVPEFNFNLIPISKLISTLRCNLTFAVDFCKIQDVTALKMISLAKLMNELYHLVISKDDHLSPHATAHVNSFVCTPITASNIWHFRLGHLSGKCLNSLSQSFPFIPKHINATCDICHLVKQKKLSYSASMSRATKIFELIHLDIWGPFSKVSIHGTSIF